MITIKSDSEIQLMREAGEILRDTLNMLAGHVKPAGSTAMLITASISATLSSASA